MRTVLFRKYSTELFKSYSAEEFVNDTIFQRICKRKDAFQIISLLQKELPEKNNDLAYRILCGLHTTWFKQSHDIKQAGWNRIMQKNRNQRSFLRQIRVVSKKELEERIGEREICRFN